MNGAVEGSFEADLEFDVDVGTDVEDVALVDPSNLDIPICNFFRDFVVSMFRILACS